MMWFLGKNNQEKKERLDKYLKPKWSQWPLTGDGEKPPADIVLNFDELAESGFLTPDRPNTELARNYSAIKRRLFQRLSYFRHDPSMAGAAGGIAGKAARPVVLVTSGSPAEGKTFSTTNLALSLALEERIKVLLIDADLAKPGLPDIFGYSENKPGLFEYLTSSGTSIEDFILKVSPLPILVLPAGQATSSPAQLLGGDVMTELIGRLTTGPRLCDIVLLDGPPILATTEAVALAPVADEVVLVVGTGDATILDIGACLDFLGGTDHVSMIMNRLYFSECGPSACA
jgi:Mrp family chromosome partitioning ATPase